MLDEGELTASVVRRFAVEDGRRGDEAARAVRPARLALWEACVDHAQEALSKALRERNEQADPPGRSVSELRQAAASWLWKLPTCGGCGASMGSVIGKCPSSKSARKCRASKAKRWASALLSPECTHGWSQAKETVTSRVGDDHYSIQIDRDASVLLEVSGSAKAHEEIQKARKVFDRAMSDALVANGRLILRVQRKRYTPRGGVTRADLVQVGALGCRRALLDFDGSKSKFSTYAAYWIRQKIGEEWGRRDAVGLSQEVQGRRRRLIAKGIDPRTLHHAMLELAEVRSSGPLAYLPNIKGLLEVMAPALGAYDPETTVSSLVSLIETKCPKLTAHKACEAIAGWCAEKIDGKRRCTGSALLSAIEAGDPTIVSVVSEETHGEDHRPLEIVLVTRDLESQSFEMADHATAEENRMSFTVALEKLTLEDPEAAEVLRRRHGLDVGGETKETLEEICAGPLLASGRKLSREMIRVLGLRGRRKIQAYIAASAGPDSDDETWTPKRKAATRPPLRPKTVVTMSSEPVTHNVSGEGFEEWKRRADEVSSIAW